LWNIKDSDSGWRIPLKRILFHSRHAACCAAFAVGLIGLASVACAMGDSAAIATTQRSSQVEPAGVVRLTLKNGMQVVVVRNTLAPVVTVQANILAGGRNDPAGFPGMAHAQEHMSFRGCANMTADQTAALYAQLGDENNADTQQEITEYYATVPAVDVDVALEAQANCLRDVDDAPAEWKEERLSLEKEVDDDLSDPVGELLRRINLQMFAGTAYAADSLGTRESYDRMTGAEIKAFYQRWYRPSNEVLVIVGDVNPAAILKTVTKLYGDIPDRPAARTPEIVLHPFKPERIRLQSDSGYTEGYIAFRLPGTDSPDYAATTILADVLSSERSKLYGIVDSGLAEEAGFALEESYRKASVGLAVVAVAPDANVDVAMRRLRHVLYSYAVNGVPEDIVDAARRNELTQRLFQSNSIPGLATVWSRAVAGEGRSSPDDDYEAIRKVTRADVNRVARRYLLNVATVDATLMAGTSGLPVRRKSFRRAEKKMVAGSVAPIELPPWAAGRLEALNVPATYPMPSDMRLANGLRLIVRTVSSSPTVTLLGSVRHSAGMQTEPGKEGVSDIVDTLYESGTQQMDRVVFQTALDDISAVETAGYQFSLSVTKEHLDRGMQLLAENELDPVFDTRSFAMAKKVMIQRVAADRSSVSYLSGRALDTALLPAGDPTLRTATPQTLSRITLDEARAYYSATIRPDLTTIVMVGDISPEDAKAVVERWFGGWTVTGPTPGTVLPSVPLNRASAVEVVSRAQQEDSVVLAEQIATTRHDPAFYALQLGTQVLGRGFYAARLYRDLRRDAGYVYMVDVDFDASATRATYSVSYECSPENVAVVRSIVERDLKQMGTEDISPEELQRAKAILLRQIPLQESSEDELAVGILDRAEDGLPLDEPVRAAKRYVELDADSVRRAFAEDIHASDFVQVVSGPGSSTRQSRLSVSTGR